MRDVPQYVITRNRILPIVQKKTPFAMLLNVLLIARCSYAVLDDNFTF